MNKLEKKPLCFSKFMNFRRKQNLSRTELKSIKQSSHMQMYPLEIILVRITEIT